MREPINVQVKIPELDGRPPEKGGLPRRADAPPGGDSHNLGAYLPATALLTLKNDCKALMGDYADVDEWNSAYATLNRHFWKENEFLPEKRGLDAKNCLENAIKGTFVALTLRVDHYTIYTPNETLEWVLDPELPVRQTLEKLRSKQKINAVSCYDVLNHEDEILDLDKSLYIQGVLPYAWRGAPQRIPVESAPESGQ